VTGRTLVAGVGNIFRRDDAFGVEVIRVLMGRSWPDGVEIADFGIRGIHLVYELLNGCDLLVLIDAAQRGCEPGTVTVLEVGSGGTGTAGTGPGDTGPNGTVMDAHGLAPHEVFAMLASLESRPGRSLVVACEPADVSDGMGLSDAVREAVPHAVRAVEEILGRIKQEEQEEGTHDDVLSD
jgi:hydrogenase maturation protease